MRAIAREKDAPRELRGRAVAQLAGRIVCWLGLGGSGAPNAFARCKHPGA